MYACTSTHIYTVRSTNINGQIITISPTLAGKLSTWIPSPRFAQRLVVQPTVPTAPEAATRNTIQCISQNSFARIFEPALLHEAMMELRGTLGSRGWCLHDEVLSVEKGGNLQHHANVYDERKVTVKNGLMVENGESTSCQRCCNADAKRKTLPAIKGGTCLTLIAEAAGSPSLCGEARRPGSRARGILGSYVKGRRLMRAALMLNLQSSWWHPQTNRRPSLGLL